MDTGTTRMETARVTSFGDGTFAYALPSGPATVGEALHAHGIKPEGRRLAVNGQPATIRSTVVEGDEVTVVPRVHAG